MIKKTTIRRGLLSIVAVLTLGLGVSATVSADDDANHTETTTQETTTSREEAAQKLREAKARLEAHRKEQAAKRAETKEHLSEAKKKVCENRKTVITKLMTKNAENAQKHFTQITTISERVQKFYTEKGKVLANYDELLAAVNEKKVAAQAAVEVLKDNTLVFDCSAENPKGTLQDFKQGINTKSTALKEYRTAVKNLIVGVKSVQSTTEPTQEEQQ